MTMPVAPRTAVEPVDPEVVALIMATLLTMEEGRESSEGDYRIRIRESWPRTTLWRWL